MRSSWNSRPERASARQLWILERFGDGSLACRELAGIDLCHHGGDGWAFGYALGRYQVTESQQNERNSLPTPLGHAAKSTRKKTEATVKTIPVWNIHVCCLPRLQISVNNLCSSITGVRIINSTEGAARGFRRMKVRHGSHRQRIES